jgi:hypothetical protein
LKYLIQPARTLPVPVRHIVKPHLLSIPPVSVKDQAKVCRDGAPSDFAGKALFIKII